MTTAIQFVDLETNPEKPNVKVYKVGDEVLLDGFKFKITYLREHPVRMSLEPVPFVPKEEKKSDGNEVEAQGPSV